MYMSNVAIIFSEVLEMNINADDCGETFSVRTWNEYTLFAPGDFTGSVCSYTFMGQAKGNCLGLCYDVKKKSFFKPNSANLTMQSGSHLQVI